VVWITAGTLGYPWGPWLKMVVLTAQRRTEVASMRWSDIDLDKALWTLPAESTKAGRIHDVPLSDAAMDILKNLQRMAGDYVWTHNGGTTHITTYYEAKAAIDAAIGKKLTRWTIHDLRRTAASTMAARGVPVHVLSAILNHAPGQLMGVTAIYQRYRYTEERRAALQTWAAYVLSLVEPAEKAATA
jgi:integrase